MLPHRPLWMAVFALIVASSPLRAAEADKYLPSDSKLVIVVNIQQLLDAPVVKKHALEQIKEHIKKSADAQQFLGTVGLDPLKDISSVLVAWNASVAETDKVMVIAHGKFDLGKIEATADAHAKSHPKELKISNEGGTRLYEAKGKDKDKPGFAAFVDGHTLIASLSKEYVLDSIAKSTGKKDGKLGKDMLALLEKASTKDAVSLTLLIPEEAKQMLANNPQTATFASKLESVTGAVGVTDGIQADFQVHTADAKAAEEVRKIIDAVKALLVLGVQDNKEYGPMLSDIIDNLKVTSEKSTVTISAKASADQIDKGIKKNPKSDKDK